MDLVSILINTVAGGAGGFLGNMAKKNGLGMVGNVVAGALGGNGLPAILGALAPALMGVATTADPAAPAGLNIASIASALVGGGAGSLLGGLFKKAA